MGDRSRGGRGAVALAALLLIVSACAGSSNEAPPTGVRAGLPPDQAPPRIVLEAYLAALTAGDCAASHQLVVAATFRAGNGELCGGVVVIAWRLSGTPIVLSPNETIIGTTLTTRGSSDGSIPPGDLIWSYDLVRQPSGAWRIVSAGQG